MTSLLTACLLLAVTILFATVQQSPMLVEAGQSFAVKSTPGSVVTIVRSRAPWYAFSSLLVRAFRKAIPTYQAIDGLRFKAFSSVKTSKGKFIGGIYLWDSEAQARRWYTPDWFADVKRKRGQKPIVECLPVRTDQVFVSPDFNYQKSGSKAVTIFIPAIDSTTHHACLTK